MLHIAHETGAVIPKFCDALLLTLQIRNNPGQLQWSKQPASVCVREGGRGGSGDGGGSNLKTKMHYL